MIDREAKASESTTGSALLIAEALEQAETGHGLQFFSARNRSAIQVRQKDETLQVRCAKRNRWLNAKPEEIVRQMALNWIVGDLGYPISRIAVEWPIQMGSDAEKERADIVVFSDDAQTDPYIIFEVKRPSITEGVEQLRSYLRWTGCYFGCWSNGDDVVNLLREEDDATGKGPYTFRDIPRIPRLGESLDELLKPLSPQDLRPIQDLRGLVQRLEHDALSNAGVAAFDELLKLFFAKLYDEIRPVSKRKQPCRFRVSAADDEQLHARLDGLFQAAKKRPNAGDLFEAGDSIKLRGEALRLCASALEPISLMYSELEVMDAAFEYLVNPEQKGQKGQYFTPRPVVRMAVRMLNPQDGEKIIDPACGSGGFLVHSLLKVKSDNAWSLDEAYRYANEYLYGADFDEKLVRVAKISMIVAGDGKANVFQVNSLDTRAWQNSPVAARVGPFTREAKDGDFDLVLTNPPFSGKVSRKAQLAVFDLYEMASRGELAAGDDAEDMTDEREGGRSGTYRKVTSMKRDLLFLERSLDLLKPGGRMAIVLPQGNLNNVGLAGLRTYLLSRARLLAVVGLHFFTFRPFASIKTSVVFLQKWGGNAGAPTLEYPVFMAVSERSGKDNRGRYIYKRDDMGLLLDEDGVPIAESGKPAAVDSDLGDIADAFDEWAEQQGLEF